MQWLADICVRRPVFASVLILSLTVVGGFAFFQLGVDRFPKVDFPTIVVTTVQPGATPEQVETEITDKIEEAVNTISGIDELRSVSFEGVSQVIVSFVLEKDVDVAAQEVRDKVNRVLPAPAARRRAADRREVRSRLVAGADARGHVEPARSARSPSSPTRRCGGSSRT
jgi:multidrug efflux pump subunit AcrB